MAKKRKPKALREVPSGADYLIGYGRPPVHSRFKRGQSGNPQGRPKKGLDPHDTVLKHLSKKITVREGGVTKKMTLHEALVTNFSAIALSGKMSGITALEKLTKLVASLTPTTDWLPISQDAFDYDWPEIEVTFIPGPSPPSAGDCVDTDEFGNVLVNAEGEVEPTILLNPPLRTRRPAQVFSFVAVELA